MRNFVRTLSFIMGVAILGSCSTKDVLDEAGDVDMKELYELKDKAFADYLIYNTSTSVAESNRLPIGIVTTIQGVSYLNKTKAAQVSATLYLVKDENRITNLQNAGVSTATQKIMNIDGIQFFTNVKDLKLTDNEVGGILDLSSLEKLEILEMNRNVVNKLILPSSLSRLRYAASATDDVSKKLSSIDLTQNSNLAHVHLPNHNITSETFKLPAQYDKLVYVDVSNNKGVPFVIPSAIFNQLATREGLSKEADKSYTGPHPEANYFAVTNVAFGEYLLYLSENKKVKEEIKLLPNTAIKHTDGVIYINKEIAAKNKVLDIGKSNGKIKTMTENGVSENIAKVKIKNIEGIEFFTGLTSLTATSNEFNVPMNLSTLTNLKELVIATAGISSLDVSKNLLLEKLDIRGSSNANLGKLSAIDLSNNIKLKEINLNGNIIAPDKFKLPTSYSDLKILKIAKNIVNDIEVSYIIPADLYNSLTEKEGVKSAP